MRNIARSLTSPLLKKEAPPKVGYVYLVGLGRLNSLQRMSTHKMFFFQWVRLGGGSVRILIRFPGCYSSSVFYQLLLASACVDVFCIGFCLPSRVVV